jgi:hypothetical protein
VSFPAFVMGCGGFFGLAIQMRLREIILGEVDGVLVILLGMTGDWW